MKLLPKKKMIKHEYKGLEIEVFDDNTYSKNSAEDKNKYDLEYADKECSKYIPYSKHGIRILKDKKIIKSAILLGVGGPTIISENSTILDEDRLIVCVANNIFSLTIPDLELDWKIKADTATCFEIFKIEEGYIVHGELEISKINKKWMNS